MAEEDAYPDIFQFLWNLGYILTSIMQISHANDVPILVQSFRAGSELFDVLGLYNYGLYQKERQSIRDTLTIFINEINKEHDPVYIDIINYSKAFSHDLIQFIENRNIK